MEEEGIIAYRYIKRYMNQPKTRAPTTIITKRETPYRIRAFFSVLRIRASTEDTKAE
jgi:hypothetical protein